MERMSEVIINGKTHRLNFSIGVWFEVSDKYGNLDKVSELLDCGGSAEFEAVQWLALKMAEDGELLRRERGFDKQAFLKPSDISIHMRPIEYADLKFAITHALNLGYKREIESNDEDEEIDVGLAELNQKKTNGAA